MSESRKTIALVAAAGALVALAWATGPRVGVPAVSGGHGERLFPAFTDPNAAASLEVVEYDEERGVARPFRVQQRAGGWTIPSQHDYPADAAERLARTATALIALRHDDVAAGRAAGGTAQGATDSTTDSVAHCAAVRVSDRVADSATDNLPHNATDHERYGVRDPLDQAGSGAGGRGVRVTVRGEDDRVLVDVILGKAVDAQPEFRYVRLPGQNRVYTCRADDLDMSTALADWTEHDLLQLGDEEVDAINLRYYSVDEATRRVSPGDVLLLQKPAGAPWALSGTAGSDPVDEAAVGRLIDALAGLRLVGVLPKPVGITGALGGTGTTAMLTEADRADLVAKGFYLTPSGQLLSNEGEAVLRTRRGLLYTLRFGEVVPDQAAGRESRYLFVTVDFDRAAASSPARAADGAAKAAVLRARFAPWYYVISAESFASFRVRRGDLVNR